MTRERKKKNLAIRWSFLMFGNCSGGYTEPAATIRFVCVIRHTAGQLNYSNFYMFNSRIRPSRTGPATIEDHRKMKLCRLVSAHRLPECVLLERCRTIHKPLSASVICAFTGERPTIGTNKFRAPIKHFLNGKIHYHQRTFEGLFAVFLSSGNQ